MNCIVTLAVGDLGKNLLKHTFSYMEAYAKKVEVDLFVIEEPVFPPIDAGRWTYVREKAQVADYLDDYEYVLYLDADIYVQRCQENIFDYCELGFDLLAVKDMGDLLSAVSNPPKTQLVSRFQTVEKTLGQHPLMTYERFYNNYINSGVLLLKHTAKGLMQDINDNRIEQLPCPDQDLLNYILCTKTYSLFLMPFKWNMLFGFDNTNYRDANFLHLGGVPDRTPFLEKLMELEQRKRKSQFAKI